MRFLIRSFNYTLIGSILVLSACSDSVEQVNQPQTPALPVPTITPSQQHWNQSFEVNIYCGDLHEQCPAVYYTLDGSIPNKQSSSQLPFVIENTVSITVINFFISDDNGNSSDMYSKTYYRDTTPPEVSVDPPGGIYNKTQIIKFECIDSLAGCESIFYTLDPTLPSDQFQPLAIHDTIEINSDSNLSFYATDCAGNASTVNTESGVYQFDSTAPHVTGQLIFDEITPNSITLSWENATDNFSTHQNLLYRVYYSLNNNLNSVTDILRNATPSGEWSGGINYKRTQFLKNSTPYYWTVLIMDEAKNFTFFPAILKSTSAQGILDTSFGKNGIITTEGMININSPTLQSSATGESIVVDSGGNIYITGSVSTEIALNSQMSLWKFTDTGELDNSFGTNGLRIGNNNYSNGTNLLPLAKGNSLAIHNNTVFATGITNDSNLSHMTLWGFDVDGTPSGSTWQPGGQESKVIGDSNSRNSFGNDIAIDSKNNLITVGSTDNFAGNIGSAMHLWRYKFDNIKGIYQPDSIGGFSNGVLFEFNSNSSLPDARGNIVMLDSSDNIFVAGFRKDDSNARRATIWKFSSIGYPIKEFGSNGILVIAGLDITATVATATLSAKGILVAIVPPPKNLTEQLLDFYVLRFSPADGALDLSFGTNGIAYIPNNATTSANITDITTDDFDNILISGNMDDRVTLWRFRENGDLDTSFGENGIVSLPSFNATGVDRVNSITIDQRGGYLLTGYSLSNSKSQMLLIRLH